MRKLRVYELARHYGVHHKKLLELLHKMKVDVKSHMSVVDDASVDTVHSVFERKREVARLNYAKAHGLDPEKLKHVASLKPLERPVPVEEPEPKKKVRKKKTAKKKVAKAKESPKSEIVIIKKAGAQTAVTRKVAEKKKAAEKAETARQLESVERAKRLEEDRAVARAEHRKSRLVLKKKLVKKADKPELELPEEAPTPDLEPMVTDEPAAVPTVEAAPVVEVEKVEPKKAEPKKAESAPKKKAQKPPLQSPKRKVEADAPKVGASKESVKASVQAAIRKRQDERAAREPSPRRKRSRRRQKVDKAEVERQVKQTMAQMGGGAPGKRKKRKGGVESDVEAEEILDVISVTEFVTVQELAEKLEIEVRDIITRMFGFGVMVTINQRLDKENIEMLAEEYDREIEFISEYGEEVLEKEDGKDGDLQRRAPVVTVMGHVDHGKTSLLDFIRSTNVIAGEAGSITQHIGAYRVETDAGPITFLDTPGHAAFSAMRARGAQATDIVILVVAADDRVMPQTLEAIRHAKAANVPIIVAINKIDLPAANPDLVKQELAQHGVQIEEYGGDILCAEISAKKGTGIDNLLAQIHLQSEVQELLASSEGAARGTVIEASKEPGRGVVFTVLIERGTLTQGDIFLVGVRDGRVRAMFNERGDELTIIGPSEPAVILGARDVPQAGDRFYVMKSEREAREIAAKRAALMRQQQLAGPKKKVDLDNLAEMISAGDFKELPIIIKGDVSGSVEALADQLLELNTSEVKVDIIHKAVGAVSESDVLLAANTGALIIGFHMRPGVTIRDMARDQHVTIEVFDIIYEAVDTLKKAMAGLLDAIQREVAVGTAEVREVFSIPKLGEIAGSHVTKGVIKRNCQIRLVRDEVMIFTGKISSLKRFKDDAKEVQKGFDCGIGLENFHELHAGDVIEAYEIEEIARTEL